MNVTVGAMYGKVLLNSRFGPCPLRLAVDYSLLAIAKALAKN